MFNISPDIAADIILQLSEERLALFFRMVDCILLRSITEWPKRIQDNVDKNCLESEIGCVYNMWTGFYQKK